LGLGGREYIGNPKQPPVTVCQLVNELYKKHLFHQADVVSSATFSELSLEVNKIFAAGQG
jgi:Uma2 family endonuclease